MSIMQQLFSKRALMVGLIAGSSALVASSFAMPGGGAGPAGCAARQGDKVQNMQSKREAFRAKRLAGLKEKLQLKPEQEAAWLSFANAAQPPAKGVDRQALRDEFKTLNTPQRMDKMLALANERHARMAQRAESVKRFYAQLSAEQQSVFDAESRMFRHGKHGHHGGRGQQS